MLLLTLSAAPIAATELHALCRSACCSVGFRITSPATSVRTASSLLTRSMAKPWTRSSRHAQTCFSCRQTAAKSLSGNARCSRSLTGGLLAGAYSLARHRRSHAAACSAESSSWRLTRHVCSPCAVNHWHGGCVSKLQRRTARPILSSCSACSTRRTQLSTGAAAASCPLHSLRRTARSQAL